MEKDLELTAEQKLGLSIEAELETLFKMGKGSFSIEEIEPIAPKTYDLLYDVCEEEDSENGVETSRFKLVEAEGQNGEVTFKITKK
jgi:hypothetical protein